RRHTRFSRDWSSDVCSSDLGFDKVVVVVRVQRIAFDGVFYENAIESDPLNADYYNDFADTLREVKRYEEALEMARQAIALDPSMVLAYETLAQIYEEMGRPEDAAAAMEQANALRVAEA